MKKARKIVAALCAGALAVACLGTVVGCSSSSDTQESQESESETQEAVEEEPQTIVIGCPDEDGMLTDNGRIAQALGYLDEELEAAGYEVEYVSFGWGGVPLNEALMAADIDVAFSDAWAETLLVAGGMDVKAVATVNAATQNGICVSTSSGITSVADLAGKRVICPSGSSMEMYLSEVAEANGLDLSTIERVDTVSDMVTIFMSGEADALLYGLYTSYYMENYQVGTTLCDTKNDPDQWQQSYVIATSDYWAENPEAAKAIIRALDRAQQWAEETAADDPDTVYTTMSKDEEAASINARIYDFDLSFSFFSPEITQQLMDRYEVMTAYMYENGLITEEVSADDFFDTTYLEEVAEEA